MSLRNISREVFTGKNADRNIVLSCLSALSAVTALSFPLTGTTPREAFKAAAMVHAPTLTMPHEDGQGKLGKVLKDLGEAGRMLSMNGM